MSSLPNLYNLSREALKAPWSTFRRCLVQQWRTEKNHLDWMEVGAVNMAHRGVYQILHKLSDLNNICYQVLEIAKQIYQHKIWEVKL